MPACFKGNYPATPIIIDCTELFIEMPSSFRAQSQTYSSYKSHNTAKGLVGIAPSGCDIYFMSQWRHISDKKITQECGLIHLLESGDVVMADRGFDIQHLLASKCVTLNMPYFFLRDKSSCHRGGGNTKNCIHSYSCGASN